MRLYSGEGHRKCLRPAFQLPLSLLRSGYQWKGEGILSLRGHLVIPGNTFGCYNLGDCAPGILWREARDATNPLQGLGHRLQQRAVLSKRAPRLRNVTLAVPEGDVLGRNKGKNRIKVFVLRPTQVLLPQSITWIKGQTVLGV